jgi:hypothetical protein
VITLIGENLQGQTPDVAGLQQWAQTFGLTHPVVADPGWGVTVDYAGYSFGLPSMHQLGAGAVVLRRGTWVSEQQVVDALP